MEQKTDLTLSGVATSGGGAYHTVKGAGVCTVKGELSAESLQNSGWLSCKAAVTATEAKIDGSATFHKDFSPKKLKITGFCSVKGKLRADEVDVCGSLEALELSAETVTVSGALTVEKEADIGTLTLSSYDAKIELLHADIVKQTLGKTGAFSFFGLRVPTLGTVECTVFEAEGVKADKICCETAVIGKHCKIGTVEYSKDITVDPDAEVGAIIKID